MCEKHLCTFFGGAKKALQPDNPINAHNENIDKIFFFMVFQN